MKVAVLCLLLAVAYAKHEEYSGWKAYSVSPSNFEQLKTVGLLVQKYDLDYFQYATVDRAGVILVQPFLQDVFTDALKEEGINYNIYDSDIKRRLDIEDEELEQKRQQQARSGQKSLSYDSYQEWEDIEAYMEDVAERFPSTVTLVNAGSSFEGRNLKYLKISTTNFEDTSKPVIFIEGGVHAREWISPPTVTWAINKLTDNVTEPDMLANFDWILFPVVNPDGYKFSFTTTRLWRKTRSTDQNAISYLCPGVDGNRNFDFHWGEVGSSSSPCAETYPGATPFSEVEIRAVRDIIFENVARMPLFITMHSYGSMILYPWGHDGSLSNNAFALQIVGNAMASAIDRLSLPNFPNYVVGNSYYTIGYGASGASEDYAHSIGVPISFTVELPGLFQGFQLSAQYIQQVAIETWAGVVAAVRETDSLLRTNVLKLKK